jgi:hypothetical protein
MGKGEKGPIDVRATVYEEEFLFVADLHFVSRHVRND